METIDIDMNDIETKPFGLHVPVNQTCPKI